MPIRTLLFLCVAVLVLPACSTTSQTTDDSQRDIVGQPVDVLYDQWGEPDREMPLPDSDRVVQVWNLQDCQTHVTVDAEGLIEGFALSGDCALSGQ